MSFPGFDELLFHALCNPPTLRLVCVSFTTRIKIRSAPETFLACTSPIRMAVAESGICAGEPLGPAPCRAAEARHLVVVSQNMFNEPYRSGNLAALGACAEGVGSVHLLQAIYMGFVVAFCLGVRDGLAASENTLPLCWIPVSL